MIQLSPQFVSGFADAEGCFSVSIFKYNKFQTGWGVLPVFAIGLHGKDASLLHKIKSYFGVGGIWIEKSSGLKYLCCTSPKRSGDNNSSL
jgi:hypothetical protein